MVLSQPSGLACGLADPLLPPQILKRLLSSASVAAQLSPATASQRLFQQNSRFINTASLGSRERVACFSVVFTCQGNISTGAHSKVPAVHVSHWKSMASPSKSSSSFGSPWSNQSFYYPIFSYISRSSEAMVQVFSHRPGIFLSASLHCSCKKVIPIHIPCWLHPPPDAALSIALVKSTSELPGFCLSSLPIPSVFSWTWCGPLLLLFLIPHVWHTRSFFCSSQHTQLGRLILSS